MDDNKRKLYDALSEDYDLGTFEQFSNDIADESKRRKLYDAAIEDYDFGDFDTFSSQLGFGKGASSTAAAEKKAEVPDNFEDEPDMRALNEKTVKEIEKNAQKEAREEQKAAEKAARDAKKARSKMTPQERTKAFNEQFRNRQQEYARQNPEAWEIEKSLIRENDELGKQDFQEQKKAAEKVEKYGDGGLDYTSEDATFAGEEYEDLIATNDDLNRSIETYNKTGNGDYNEINEKKRDFTARMDALMNSPVGQEYTTLSEQYQTLKNADDTPENRWAMAQLAGQLSRNPLARVSMGEDAPSLSQIDFDTNRAEVEYIESQMDGADRKQKKEYKARLKELNHEVLDNKYYQEDVERRIIENAREQEDVYARMEDIRKRVMKEKSKLETLDDALLAEPEYQKLKLAANQLEQTGRKLSHIRDKNAGDFWVNFMDVFTDPNTYNLNITNLETALMTKAASMTPEKAGSEQLLSAVAGANATSQEESQFVDAKGRWGAIAANSIPFMFQIGLTGGFSGVAEGVSGAVAKAAGKNASKFITKATGAVLGDLAAGFVSANTIGGAKTMSDILNNYYGTLQRGEDGTYGYVGGQSLGSSVWGGEVGNTIEFASERAGDHLQHLIGRGVLGWGIRQAQKNGKGAVNVGIEELAKSMDVTLKDFGFRSANQAGANWAQKALGTFTKTLNKVGIQGYPFEVAEEYIGLLGNILLGGEEKWMDFSKLGDKETHADIWGGMLYSIGLTQAGTVSLAGAGAIANGVRKARAYHALENALEANSVMAETMLGKDNWASIKETIDGTTNKDLAKKVTEYMDDPELDPQQKAAILDYVKNTYIYRGFNAGTIAQARERISNSDNLRSLDMNAEVATAQDQIADAYMLGYQSGTGKNAAEEQTATDRKSRRSAQETIEQAEEIRQAVERQKARFAEITGIPDMSEEAAARILEDETNPNDPHDQDVRDAALDYLMAVAVEKGFNDAEENRQIRGKAAIEARLRMQYGQFYYEDGMGDRIVESSKTPNPATKQWENIFLLSGTPNENGEVPFVSTSGRRGYVKREQLADYEDDGTLVPGLTKVKGLNEFLDEQYLYEQTQREAALAQQDAEQTAVREAAEAQQAQGENRAVAEGRIGEDGTFTYNGKKGHLIRKTDEGAVFEPEDGSDNVELTWEQLAQGSEESAPEPAPVPAPAPEQGPNPPAPGGAAAEEETEEEGPKIPVDEKTGEKIYDAPGVSVEDALVDIYTTEGVSEEMGDQFIREEAEKAEKGRNPKRGKMTLAEWGAATKEANRKADFWAQLKEIADENTAARKAEEKAEAKRQELIKQYGVDTSTIDEHTPMSMEEAIAESLAGFFRGGGRLSQDSVLGLIGKDKGSELWKGGYRSVVSTKPDALPVDKFVNDVMDEYPGLVTDEQDAINKVGELLLGMSRGELGKVIFNNRLKELKDQADYLNNVPKEGTPAPAAPEVKEEPKPAPKPEPKPQPGVPKNEGEEGKGGEQGPAVPEGQAPEGQGEKGGEKGGEKPGNVGNNGGNSVPLEEGEKGGEGRGEQGPAAPETGAGNNGGTEGGSEGAAPAEGTGSSIYGSDNKVVTKERYEELRKKMLEKIKGQANAGFDPEIFAMGVEMAAYHIEAGARKFVDFAKRMIADLTDAIRPYLKGIYNGARDLPGMEEYKKEMDSAADVDKIDINADFNELSDEQDTSDLQQGEGGVSGPETDSDGEGGEGQPGDTDESADNGDAEEDNGSGGDEGGSGDVAGEGSGESGERSGDEGANGTPGGKRRGGRKANDGKSTGKNTGRRGGSRRGENDGADGVGRDTDVEEETEEQKEERAAKTEQAAYEAEKERIKDETDTNALKKLFNEIKDKLTGITDKFDEARAKLSGQLRAIREKLQDLFSKNVNKSEALAQEKVPYSPVSDPTGEHAIGSVVPSGSADYMRDAIKRLEKEVGKPVAEFVMEELGYESLDEMFTTADKEKFTGLSSEQVDAVGLAIQQIKTGRIFIVGDMTGVGKGRVGAALIRWGHRHGKKVIFCTEQPNLFTSMYEDINDIGGLDRGDAGKDKKGKGRKKAVDTAPLPFIINNNSEANITDDDDSVIVRHSNEAQRSALFASGKDELPEVPLKKYEGRKYDFVMTTYSQLQASEEEEEGESDKVKKKNERNTKGRQRIQWLKQYAKDAVVIMDESHTAAGQESTRGENALKLVDAAQGVMFMSATFAKTPQAMSLYAVRSSMNEAQISRQQLISAIANYGIPMQEILSASLYKTGEYVRRERDFDGVKTNWCQPEEIYTKAEIETARGLSDYTASTINDIIDFQRRFVEPIIRSLNKAVADQNRMQKDMYLAGITDSYTEISYSTTSYAGQVSNVIGMMLFAIKAKKAADMAIEQMKKGEKPVIAVDNTLGAYIDEIEGNIESADFGTVLRKGLAFVLKYQMTTKKFVPSKGPHGEELRSRPKEVRGDRVVEKFDSIADRFGEPAEDAMRELEETITTYGKETLKLDLTLSPIDYIKKRIEDAGFKCGEITKRQNALVQNEDGTWKKEPIKHNKKEVIRKFNGGKATNPLPKEETYDAVIMNRSGATGNSMHASRKFGDQRPRKMIILQAAKDPNNEVQIRGRIDRTGQVHRGEYFYIISPIPAEKKITMMLKQKLASLDAQSVGTENVSSNKVDAEDMDNKYGDEIAKDFLAEHPEINLQLDKPIVQVFDRKKREMVWKGRTGLLYDLLKGMQRMTCAEQEMILQELEETYKQKIEYLNQNGINDLATATMDLEATTIDKAIMVKGKNNESMSEFAHDTNIERVEANVLRKPLRSEDIVEKEKELGVFEKHEKTNSHGEKEDVSYGEYVYGNAVTAAQNLRDEKKRKQKEAEQQLAEDLKAEMPQEEGESDADYESRIYNDPRAAGLRTKNETEFHRYQATLQDQLGKVRYATTYLKPGYAYLVPLNEDEKAQTMYGRFMGFKAGKDGRPSSVEAVFATKDSRAQVSLPVVGMSGMIERIANTNNPSYGDMFGKTKHDFESEEARIQFYDDWWDKMIPEKTARQVRYMITGNILQAVGQLNQHRGMIVTFTRKDAETGEITIDKGLLLAEDFDPENFMVRTEVTKEDVWNNAGEFRDNITNIAVFRDGDRLRVKFFREKGSKEDLADHDVNSDEDFKALCEDGEIIAASKDELHAVISEENAAAALKMLYTKYGFTQGHLLILPDSTDKPDRIVPTGKSYDAVINELQPKYHCWSASSCQSEIDKLLKVYKMDINNEDVKRKIRELVQLRQAYIRKSYCKIDTPDLAWHIVISEQEIAQLERPVPNETPEAAQQRKKDRQDKLNIMEAFREELASREPQKGHMRHFKQGKTELKEIIKTFKEFNSNKENARIAEKVFAVMKKLNVNIFMDENATDNPRKRQAGGMTAGDYLMYNWRFMNEDTIPDQLKADTILHEMCHTMTAYVLEAINSGATSLIPGLVDAGKQADVLYWAIFNNKNFSHQAGEGASGIYWDYGRKDVYEMLAETGASQRFRDDLAKVKVTYKEESTSSFGKTRTNYYFTDVTDSKEPTGETMTALEAAMDILERMIDGFTEDGYKKMWTGTGYGAMGYKKPGTLYRRGDANSENLSSPVDRAMAISSAVDLAKRLGVKFKEDPNLKAKGSFDPKTGQIKINVDRHANAEDLKLTILHEAVAHYGLRKLLGKDFDSEMRSLYDNASPEIKAKIDEIAKRDGLSTEVATEEYLATLAEDGRFDAEEESFWRKMWNDFVGWLRDLGFNIRLTDADMRALMYASYRNLQTRGAVAQAHHISVMNALRKQAELSHEENDEGPDDKGPSGGSRMNREKARIKEKAIKDGTFMKAPNGQPSNLSEDRWLLVRTKAFKKWFGDWENEPENASQVVDANGEPLVVYHGGSDGIVEFNPLKLGTNTGAASAHMGFFFTSSEIVGRSYIQRAQYVARGELKEYFDAYRNKLNALKEKAAAKRAEADELWRKHNSFVERLKNFIESLMDSSTKTLYRQWRECVDEALALEETIRDLEVRDWADPDFQEYQRMLSEVSRGGLEKWFENHERVVTQDAGTALYPVFLNMRNPYVSKFNSEEDRRMGWYSKQVGEAKKNGSDGAILYDVVDPGVEAIGTHYEMGTKKEYVDYGVTAQDYYRGDDYVVFKPSQIKSVDIEEVDSEDFNPRNIHHLNDGMTSEELEEEFGEGMNDLPDEVKQLAIDQQTGELYRRSRNEDTAQTAAQFYGNNVRTVGSALYEVGVDELHPVDTLMEALAKESKKPIKDDERVSDMIRETGGKAMHAIREYNKKFLQPMWSAVGEFRKKTGSSIKDTETYIGLKSGLERNVVLAKRDAKRDYENEYNAEIDAINQEEKDKKKFLDGQLKAGKISDVTYQGELTTLQQEMKQKRDKAEAKRNSQFANVDAGLDPKYKEYRKNDYSALTAWAETNDLEEAERLAGDYVSDMEQRAGKQATNEVWKRINAATKETLKFQYEHQMLSRQQYSDVSKMMEYYVPMRGFAEDTAEDLYNYYVSAQSNAFQPTVLTAKGRKTWYEGPLGNIGAMASSAISQGVKNEAKLSLLDAVRRRPNNSVATVTRAWFHKTGEKDVNGKDIYEPVYPNIPEGATLAQREVIIDQFEKDMAEAKEKGDAYNAHREVDLHGGVVAFEREAHKNEHLIPVREGGKEYAIIINGNPAAAQAINGVKRGKGLGETILGILRGFTRTLSSMFTTFSVPFWVSNYQRDFGQGLTNASVRNKADCVGGYIKNRWRALKLFPFILGEETMDNALAKGDPVAKLYKQYLENGGPMGQNRIQDNEYFDRQMRRYLDNSAKQGIIKGATAVLDFIGGVGEAIETITRFAAFMTSMESGRSLHESISDAKEISTNFARKGSGRGFSRDELDRMTHADGTKLNAVEKGFVNAVAIGVEICRATIPFFNAAIQGLENKVTNYQEHFGKTLLADSIYFMLGLGMKLLFGGAGGDDDKEKYSHTSDYQRRNNILGPTRNGVYTKWALPQEYRVMYALGDIVASAFQKERPIDDLAIDAFGAIMQLSPWGVITDEVAFSPENKKKAYETLITNVSPGIIAPVMESIFNMDFKGARIYNEGFNENLRAYPGWTKALPTTGKEYVAAAKFLNEFSGGDDVQRGWLNVNPAIVEHLVESYFSGPYQIVVRTPEAIVKGIKGEATVRDIPLLNRIILNTNDNQRDAFYSNMYYYFKERNTEAERINSEYKSRPREGKVADFYNSDDYKYMLVFKKYDKIEKELRKASKVAAEKGDEKKKKEYDEKLQEFQYRMAKECLDIYFDRNKVK